MNEPHDSVAATFEIRFSRLLDPSGKALAPLPAWAQDRTTIVALYRAMTLTRSFDQRAVQLQRAGRIGTYASSLGQEAVGVGVASAMLAGDVLLPSFREHGALLWRGVTLLESLLAWGGDERGYCVAGPREDFPPSIPVGSHTQHAVGVALAFKLRKESRAAVCIFGDGATSKGDFYEAINAAGVWSLPVVFVANNNQWAISVPRTRQTAAHTLAQKAIAAGIGGEQVDGNDVIAVRAATERALVRARSGGGPTLLEALTYRLADHTTADDASRYRDAQTVQAEWQNEPLARLRRYMAATFHWTKDENQRLQGECAAAVDAAVGEYLATAPQAPESMFDFHFETSPRELVRQREVMLAAAKADG
jgi:pyruvate dehydrogenase E1 component alpha subunit